MTFSVVAVDRETGQLGVAVASHWFDVGRRCAWVGDGVGAVATQASTDPRYGSDGLRLLADGAAPGDVLAALTGSDPDHASRQVAVLDRTGAVAVHTGAGCLDTAAHRVGDGWSVQGNLLAGADVLDAMAAALRAPTDRDPGPGRSALALRLLACLRAGDAAGGDRRGRQSAALRVTAGSASTNPAVELSVADHADPVGELGRLLDLHDGYESLRLVAPAIDDGDEALALHLIDTAGTLADRPEVHLWRATHLLRLGREAEATALARAAVTAHPALAGLLRAVAPALVYPDGAATSPEPSPPRPGAGSVT